MTIRSPTPIPTHRDYPVGIHEQSIFTTSAEIQRERFMQISPDVFSNEIKAKFIDLRRENGRWTSLCQHLRPRAILANVNAYNQVRYPASLKSAGMLPQWRTFLPKKIRSCPEFASCRCSKECKYFLLLIFLIKFTPFGEHHTPTTHHRRSHEPNLNAIQSRPCLPLRPILVRGRAKLN